MKKVLFTILIATLMALPMSAAATTLTLNQFQLIQLWHVYSNPDAEASFYTSQEWKEGMKTGYVANPDGSVKFVGGLGTTSAKENEYYPFAQLQIGANFWGESGTTGISGPTVGDLGLGDLTGYTSFSLRFSNVNDDDWWVNLYLNTGWTDSPYNEQNNYYENGWTKLSPGQSATLNIDLTNVANLHHVTNIGFNVGGNMDTINTNPSNPDTWKIQVAPVPEPATMLLLGFGLIGLAAVGRRNFLKK